MYIFLIVLIIIASILLILAVLAQNPKSGMAANFGASNQVMGVRQTSDFLEKFTWAMALAIVVLSLLTSIAMSSHRKASQNKGDKVIEQVVNEVAMPTNAIPMPVETEATEEVTEE